MRSLLVSAILFQFFFGLTACAPAAEEREGLGQSQSIYDAPTMLGEPLPEAEEQSPSTPPDMESATTPVTEIPLEPLQPTPEMSAFGCPAEAEALAFTLPTSSGNAITGLPVQTGNFFLEGPVWIDGSLYFSQIRDYGDANTPNPAQLLKYTPQGSIEEVVAGAGTNGLAVNGAGLLIAASHKVGGIVSYDPSDFSKAAVVISDSYGGSRFNSPNDLTIRSDGTIYFSDPDWQCSGCGHQSVKGVYKISPGGTPELLTVLQSNPNGISLSPDEQTLYIGGDQLAAYPVMADGSIGAGSAFGDNFFQNSDGLAIDCAGRVYVTTGDASVKVFAADGSDLGSISASGARNVAFGGVDNSTLYIVGTGGSVGVLYAVELGIPGYPY